MLKPYKIKESPIIEKGPSATTGMLNQLGSMAGTAIGTAVGGPAGAAIGGALGSQLGNVATGEAANAQQMAMAGLTSGIGAGAKGVVDAKEGLQAAQASGEGIAQATKALETAESSMFNDPFGKMGNKVKSVFMADGGEVEQTRQQAQQMVKPRVGPLKLMRDENGRLVLPDNIDFSRMQPVDTNEAAAQQQQEEFINYRRRLTEEANRKAAEARKAEQEVQKLYAGGKAKGPLCASCEADYKAYGGKAKKKC